MPPDNVPPSPSAESRSQALLGLPAATLAGLFLRVLLIGSKSLWLDEAMSLYITSRGPQAWLSGLEAYHPPLYYAFLSLWVHLGRSEGVLRLSSALFGVVTIPVAYLLARCLAGKGVARATAWLVALSPLLVWYSQEFRSYSLLVFLVLLSSLAFVRLVLAEGAGARAGWWLLYVLATTAALYTHYYGVLVVPVEVALLLVLAAQRRLDRTGLSLALAAWPVILAAFWPWLSSPAAGSFAGLAGGTGGYLGMLVQRTLGVPWSLAILLLAGCALVLVAVLLGVWALIRRRGLWPQIYRSRWLRAVLLLAFVALLALSVIPRGYSIKRLAVTAIPFACLIVAWFWPLTGRVSKALAALLALSLVAALVNVVAIPKDDWRAAWQFLRSAYQAGDAVWITPGYDNLPFDYYNRGGLPVTEIDDPSVVPALSKAQTGRTWLVYNVVPLSIVSSGPQVETALTATYRPSREWSAYRIRVVLFEPR